jgi:eukaryotic-like serine/threonine-protein kinase
MLTSHPPFVGETVQDVLAAHQNKKPARVAAEILDCPVWLDLLVQQLLEKDPAKRPKTAATVYYALKETEKKVAEGGSVSAHAISGGAGFNPLKVKVDPELKKIVAPRKKKVREVGEKPAFYERAWFLVLCLLVVASGIVWLAWPLSEGQLFARAEKLMKDPEQHEFARTQYLEPLLKRFPGGPHATQAQEYLDLIETDKAAAKVRNKAKTGRTPTCEGQKLCSEAFTMEQFGDQETALEKYKAIVELLKPEGEDAQYVKLAKRKIKELENSPLKALPREEFLKSVLDGIESLLVSGERDQAKEKAESIISLYAGNKTLEPFVKRAEEIIRLVDTGEKPQSGEKPTQNPGENSNLPPDVPLSAGPN